MERYRMRWLKQDQAHKSIGWGRYEQSLVLMGVPVRKELRTHDEGGMLVVNLLAHNVLRASAEFFRKARAMRHKLL
jgi:hypothetical protein